ncbi:hypothetical protein [Vibrio sinaloensis]|nr:hypothetical protein [Vibrio sinaloensis]
MKTAFISGATSGFGLHGEHLLLNQAEHSSLNAEHETLRITLKHLLTRWT